MPSVMCKLKEQSKKQTPKRVLQFVSQEAGGIMEATSAGALPRNRQQIKDARRKDANKQQFDPLYSVMYMCKEGEGVGGDRFIRMVNAAPFPTMLLAFDYMLDDLVRFCTSPNAFSILGVDPTFSLGDFDVTVCSYRHLLLHPCGSPSGKPPVMFGPMFIHVRKDFATYHFFSSSLVGQRQQLSSLKAFGTDGEVALEKALAASFPSAQHVRCFLHFRCNVERKLRELGVPHSASTEIVKDIMGCPTQLERGLVDAGSKEQLDSMLAGFERRWNELEKPYNSPPFFHVWFKRHCRDTVAEYMLPEVREKAGLGSPPSPYYTNDMESKNKLLKDVVQYKSSQLPDFIDKMKSMMAEQKREIERAIVSSGEYRLREEYQHLSVESSKWFKMTAPQRQRKIDRMMKVNVRDNFDPSSSYTSPLDALSLPSQLKTALWEKANDLVNDEAAIVRAPGDSDDCAWMVKSFSGKRPHFVKAGKCGFTCDEQCLSFKSMKLCSHTLALAIKMESVEKFMRWYRTMKYQPNFTTIAEAGKPSSAGKKPGRRGISKKSSEQIRKVVAAAEESHSSWRNRGSLSSVDVDDEVAQNRESVTPEQPVCQSRSLLPENFIYPATTTTVVMSPRDVHSINIGGVSGIVGGPPSLILTEFGLSMCSPPRLNETSVHPDQMRHVSTPPSGWCLSLVMCRDVMDAKEEYVGTKTKSCCHLQTTSFLAIRSM